jgi:hypothetical protein
MDQPIAAAVRQDFKVWQTRSGAWVFMKGDLGIIEARTPVTAVQWVRLVVALRGLGLVFPADRPYEQTRRTGCGPRS